MIAKSLFAIPKIIRTGIPMIRKSISGIFRSMAIIMSNINIIRSVVKSEPVKFNVDALIKLPQSNELLNNVLKLVNAIMYHAPIPN